MSWWLHFFPPVPLTFISEIFWLTVPWDSEFSEPILMSFKRHFQLFLLSESLNDGISSRYALELKCKEKCYLTCPPCYSNIEKVRTCELCFLPSAAPSCWDPCSVWQCLTKCRSTQQPFPQPTFGTAAELRRLAGARQPWERFIKLEMALSTSDLEPLRQSPRNGWIWSAGWVTLFQEDRFLPPGWRMSCPDWGLQGAIHRGV